MTAAEFKRKWARFQGKESAAYQSHFDDLCRLLGVPTPLEADPTGEFFCFQQRVVKDAELFDLEAPDASDPTERGFADVWKKGCFGWDCTVRTQLEVATVRSAGFQPLSLPTSSSGFAARS